MYCLPQSPSPSQAIQDRLRKRQKLREKFKEVFDELKELVTMCTYIYTQFECRSLFTTFASEELGIVHKGVQVGRSQVRYKVKH